MKVTILTDTFRLVTLKILDTKNEETKQRLVADKMKAKKYRNIEKYMIMEMKK